MNYLAINKVAAAILLQLSFCLVVEGTITTGDVCLSWHSSPCVGGDRGLTSTAVELRYRSSRISMPSFISSRSLQLLKNTTYNMTHSLNYSVVQTTSGQLLSADVVTFMFAQYEHGGGNCNCVDIYFDSNCADLKSRFELCGGISSTPRFLEVLFDDDSYNRQERNKITQTCSSNFSIIQINFEFFINNFETCNVSTNIEASSVELSLRLTSNKEWIPVASLFLNSTDTVKIITVNQTICSSNENNSIQFRWVQTNLAIEPSTYKRNVWSLNKVRVKFINSTHENIILCDNFSNEYLDLEMWPENNIRNGNFSNDCNYKKGLVFGIDENENSVNTVSRGLLTKPYQLFESSNIPIKEDCFMSSPSSPTPQKPLTLEQEIVNEIMSNSKLSIVVNAKFPESIELLFNHTKTTDTVPALELAYLFGLIINQLSSSSFEENTLQQFLSVGDKILQRSEEGSKRSKVAVITVIQSLDEFLFDYAPTEKIFVTSDAVLVVNEPDLEQCCEKRSFLAIDTSNIANVMVKQHAAVSIPLDLLDSLCDGNETVRVASSFYKNISQKLNFGLPPNTTVGSDVVGASLQCGQERSVTNNTISNVSIIFQHDPLPEFEINCAFIEIQEGFGEILQNGKWSNRGCKVNEDDSSETRTVCECNHLTHFAILLSPKPPELSKNDKVVLGIIGYVGVSISLLAITLTIITFAALKSLHSMRNYIHVNLCLNMAIAQIIFVAGVDKTSENSVPIHCQVIAVLLHYFFLVSFMWMLMEGVVLYVALVRVFVKHKRRYILAFTVTSYGVPLVYMGALTLPLGFLTHQPHYGYANACYLNHDTKFIWSIIAPVILIFLVNIGFLIMALYITWRHQMRQKEKSRASNFLRWIRAAFSLVVVMALTWIVGVLIFDDKLKFLAFIYPVLISFQGLFIFLVFVVFSKTVRDAYRKCWSAKVSESKLLSNAFKSRTLSSNMASNPNGKVQKKSEFLKSEVSIMPYDSSNLKEGSKNLKKVPDMSLVFTNDLALSETPDACIGDAEDIVDSGLEFEVKDYSVPDITEEVVCSTALPINLEN